MAGVGTARFGAHALALHDREVSRRRRYDPRRGLPGDEAQKEISYTLSGLKPEQGRAPRLLVQEKQLDRVLFEQDIVAPEDQPITVTFQAHLPKGDPTIHVVNEVPDPANNFRAANHSRIPFISTKLRRAPWQMKLTDEQGRARYPFLILDHVSWRGPTLSEQEQRRRDEYWPAEAGNLEHVRTGLEKLARRAFRRPVSAEELDGHVAIVKAELDAGAAFPDAVKTGMLRDRAELGRQAARLLADPRARRFSESCATQWLQLRKVGMFQPDKKLYPDYDESLETARRSRSSTRCSSETFRCGSSSTPIGRW